MAVPHPTIAVYGGNATDLGAIKNSGFNTLVLWTIHVASCGDLAYNDTAAVSGGIVNKTNLSSLKSALTDLRGGGVDTILCSIGAGGPPTPVTYQRIQTLLSTDSGAKTLAQNFYKLAAYLSLDGFDLDDEEDGIHHDTIVTFTEMLHTYTDKSIVTYCPYGVPSEHFWLDCMQKIYTDNDDEQLVSWWNLQTYGGADPQSWIEAMSDYMQNKPIGVPDANAFIVAGISGTEGPSSVQQKLATWQNAPNNLALQGSFIWNIGDVKKDAAKFAQAIKDGLNGITPN